MTGEKRSGAEEVVDMELQCVRCQARLYVPSSQIRAVSDRLTGTHRCGDPDLYLRASAAHPAGEPAEARLTATRG